ncbi:hypothetical protein E2C01_099085 [Portunus trituberculatus]|uniref:Uncharacterized protein n=1 Tax=Portunus trituberculatus TaxID=210409 RepID=A0A5B7K9D8_PORTR|nr:hypothetical protein [Portunus trituberculatus]
MKQQHGGEGPTPRKASYIVLLCVKYCSVSIDALNVYTVDRSSEYGNNPSSLGGKTQHDPLSHFTRRFSKC